MEHIREINEEQGRSYGGGEHVPPRCPSPQQEIMHIYFLICKYRARVNTLRPHKNYAYVFLNML